MEKKSYFNVGRKLTKEEYLELRNWKNAPENKSLRFWALDEISSKPNMYFKEYGDSYINGERWVYHPGFLKPSIRENPFGVSFYNIGRGLTNLEYKELKNWLKNNSNSRWRRGDKHPTNKDLIFSSYSQKSINGESWVSFDIFNEIKEKERLAYSPKETKEEKSKKWRNGPYERKFNPKFPENSNEAGQYTRFPVRRSLTDEEWTILTKWREENPDAVWRSGDRNPDRDDLVFKGYNRQCHAGETWMKWKTFEKYRNKKTLEERARRKLLERFVSRVTSSINNSKFWGYLLKNLSLISNPYLSRG